METLGPPIDKEHVVLLKRILWTLVPVIASKLLKNRRGNNENTRANKTRYNKNQGH